MNAIGPRQVNVTGLAHGQCLCRRAWKVHYEHHVGMFLLFGLHGDSKFVNSTNKETSLHKTYNVFGDQTCLLAERVAQATQLQCHSDLKVVYGIWLSPNTGHMFLST